MKIISIHLKNLQIPQQRSQQGFRSKSNRPTSANPNAERESLAGTLFPKKEVVIPSRPSTAGATRPLYGQMSLNSLGNMDPLNRPGTAGISRPGTAGLGMMRPSTAGSMASTVGVQAPIPTVPKYISNEKQVLRFYGHFAVNRLWEANHPLGSPQIDTEIVRHLTILFFLDDGTVQMSEAKTANQGLTGGNFFARGPLKKVDGNQAQPVDFAVGNSIDVLGQKILITDADAFSRDYFRKQLNIVLSPAMTPPDPPRSDHGAALATGFCSNPGPRVNSSTTGAYGTRSSDYNDKRAQFDKTMRFLNFDGRVLRFTGIEVSNDSNSTMAEQMLGATKLLSIAYYLSDNSMDVRVVKDKRAGLDESSTLLKKSKLPKNWRDVQRGKAPIYVEPADLICGRNLEFYGRTLLLIDCDAFTRSMYEEMGIIQQKIPLVKTKEKKIVHPIPQLGDGFLAIGGEQDTLGTIYGMPKPGKDLGKLQRNQNRLLRCRLVFITDDTIMATRRFALTFYLEDDTIQIYEEIVRNSGIGGGNFLNRGKYINGLPPESDEPRAFIPTDIYLGNVISINGNEMRIIEMDNLSIRFCETYPDEFPMFDTYQIVQGLIEKIGEVLKVDVRGSMKRYDRMNAGWLNKDLFVHALDDDGITAELNDQELMTLIRRFKDGDQYRYDEMCDLFSHVHYMQQMNSNSGRNYRKQSEGEDFEKSAILNSLRLNKHQLRRTLRKDVHSVDGCTTLSALGKLINKSGLRLTDSNKAMLIRYYALPKREADRLLPEMRKSHAYDSLESSAKISLTQLASNSSSRVDVRAVNKAGTSQDIAKRRLDMHKSVLRKAPAPVVPQVNDGYVDESAIVINYCRLCDDIYTSGWLH